MLYFLILIFSQIFLKHFSNISHRKDIEACQATVKLRKVLEPPTKDLIRLLRLILRLNDLTFEDAQWLQIHGKVMGI